MNILEIAKKCGIEVRRGGAVFTNKDFQYLQPKDLEAFAKEIAEQSNSRWISVDTALPKLTINKGAFTSSVNCVVLINNHGEIHEAFARLSSYGDLSSEWLIDGHNGSGWHKKVTHYFEVPEPPKD